MIHALLGDTLKNYAIAATSNQDAVEDASTIHTPGSDALFSKG